MTRTEFNQQLDQIMSKHTAHIDNRIDLLQNDIDKRFEHVNTNYRWIIGLIITATIGILGTVIHLH